MEKHSESVENYLKTIWSLEQKCGRAGTVDLARAMAVAPASVTGMLKRLDSQGLVQYRPYQGAALTAAGRKLALNIVRKHRLIETFLATVLNVPVTDVHSEAERWEHVVSDPIVERMSALLGHPESDK